MKSKNLYRFLITFFLCFMITNIYASNELDLTAKTAIAVDADTLNILYGKEINTKVYPASITKIMTAILALENLDLNKSITVSKTAIQIPWDSSSIYLKEGEILTVEELLYGLLLDSGNDAANVLGEAVSGSLSDFYSLMNKKAKELGCTGTNFVNAHGYSHDDHYTTALDIAKIFSYCVKNETFLKIISTKFYIIDETNKTNEKRYLANTNRLILTEEDSENSRYYEYAIGGKTGYTYDAGRTLVTIGKKDDKTIITAVFKSGLLNGKDARYNDAVSLFEYSFNNFEKVDIAYDRDFNFIYTNYNNKLKYNLILKDDLQLLININENITDISYDIYLNEEILQTIEEKETTNEAVGKIKFVINTTGESYKLDHNLYLDDVTSFAIINKSNYVIWIISFVFTGIVITSMIIAKIHINKNKPKRKHRQMNSKYIRK